MAANSYQPLCLSASISGSLGNNFDLTVTKSENGQELVIKTVNMTSGQVRSRVAFDRYAVSGKSVTITTLAGALNAANTAANPNSIVPTATTRIAGVNDTFSFPAYSYTTIQYRPATAVAAPAVTRLRRFSVKSLPQGIAISLSGEAAGNTRSVTILDLRGSRVADLSAAPGSGGMFRWNRTTRQGKRAAAGSYIVSIADAKGNVTSFPVICNFR